MKYLVMACHTGYAVVLDRTAFFPEGGGQPGRAAAHNGYIQHTVLPFPITAFRACPGTRAAK